MLILHFLEGLWFPCWLQSASYRRQGLIIWFSETPAVSPVTINRRLSDACLRGWPSREGVAELPESGKSIL